MGIVVDLDSKKATPLRSINESYTSVNGNANN